MRLSHFFMGTKPCPSYDIHKDKAQICPLEEHPRCNKYKDFEANDAMSTSSTSRTLTSV